MGKKVLVYATFISLIVFLGSCTKLSDSGQKINGHLKMEIVTLGDTIPASWGPLISVSNAGQYPMMVQLWFQDKDGNLYMIPYNIELNTFNEAYRYLKCK